LRLRFRDSPVCPTGSSARPDRSASGPSGVRRHNHGDREMAPNRERTAMRRNPLRKMLPRQERAEPREARFVPRLAQLERRECPSLSVGDNLNLSQEVDNQQNVTVAIDPSNPLHVFEAHMEWRGGFGIPNPFALNQGWGYGFTIRHSIDGGLTW